MGLYATLAHAVELRRKEIGIRMALGAPPQSIAGMVLRSGAAIVGGGLAAGVACAVGAARLMQAQLYGVEAADAQSWAAVFLFLALIAGLAAWLPAHRAASVDPAIALREE